MVEKAEWQFWIDTGGTFTDCLAVGPDGEERRLKVLSTGAVRARVEKVVSGDQLRVSGLPSAPDDFFNGFAVTVAGRGSVAQVAHWDSRCCLVSIRFQREHRFAAGDVIDLEAGVEAPVLAMQLLTGRTLSGQFPKAALRIATTRGTNALLEGKTATCAFFVTRGFGDLLRIGDQRRLDLFALNPSKPAVLHGPVVEVPERLAADGRVIVPLNLEAIRKPAQELIANGINVAAVALMHSHRNDDHEKRVADFLRDLGFEHVSVSSELASMIKIVPRAATAVVDAILSPIMEDYLDGVGQAVDAGAFRVMTSAGGMVHRTAYRAKDSLLSGPAGGVVGAAAVAQRAGFTRVIGFDMGGTSTDVARFEGDFDYRFEHTVGPAHVFAPAIRLETVAAGGGSICGFDGSALVVGPGSAGANPGPACYGRGGPLTLTDVNLLLGRLSAGLFGVPVFPEAAELRLAEIVRAIENSTGHRPTREELLHGFMAIADERMADAIRRISVREGYDPGEYALVAFGGAGGLHACGVAGRLGIQHILFPSDSGLLSALGLREAVLERFAERQILQPCKQVREKLHSLVEALIDEAGKQLVENGVRPDEIITRRTELELRFAGQDFVMTIDARPLETIESRFTTAYQNRYGYVPQDKAVELVTVRVVVSEKTCSRAGETFRNTAQTEQAGRPDEFIRARSGLKPGEVLTGPTVAQDNYSTLFIALGWCGVVGSAGSILLERQAIPDLPDETQKTEVVELELFTCRFQSLVEEMGVLLQRCATSVNVKERLDFSCALLDSDGELIANAPHIPVHLGALGMCVRLVRDTIVMEPEDVVITNHPGVGGSHLPDVTLMAPVHDARRQLLGYLANRAHHAEMGGIRPGSMPPDAHCLAGEGVVISPMHLVRDGRANWDVLRQVLSQPPWPSRAVEENIADLHAQLASIRLGVTSLVSLAETAGAGKLQRFMRQLKQRSADLLAEKLSTLDRGQYRAADCMDDGTPVVVCCESTDQGFVVDFTGSGRVHPGNLNATPAIVHSAVIYVLRLLVGKDVPLNEGLLRDVKIIIPQGILSPEFPDDPQLCPAVVGGNVETSQRVVDVLLQALGMAACSQGTMNNVTFGNERFSCYETVGGGAGATAQARGCSAVHVHMTNTAITDPEIMEARLPVRLERFAVRRNSGGQGRQHGGDGIERRIQFLEPVELSLLTQRRSKGPPGACGGSSGMPGQQWLVCKEGTTQKLASTAAVHVEAGDILVVETPGGGGWGGKPSER